MTIKDVREFSELVANWCLKQDDLLGFYVGIGGALDWPVVRVQLLWPNGWKSMKDYRAEDVRTAGLDEGRWLAPLEAMAREAREQAARIADPDRLPG